MVTEPGRGRHRRGRRRARGRAAGPRLRGRDRRSRGRAALRRPERTPAAARARLRAPPRGRGGRPGARGADPLAATGPGAYPLGEGRRARAPGGGGLPRPRCPQPALLPLPQPPVQRPPARLRGAARARAGPARARDRLRVRGRAAAGARAPDRAGREADRWCTTGSRRAPRPPCPPELAALGRPVAATVSVLREQKRVDVFLDAAPLVLRRLPEARLAVIGNGPLARRAARPRGRACRVHPVRAADGGLAGGHSTATCCRRTTRRSRSPCWRRSRAACRRWRPTSAARARRSRPTPACSCRRAIPRRWPTRSSTCSAIPAGAARRRVRRHAERFGVERMVAATARVYEAALGR